MEAQAGVWRRGEVGRACKTYHPVPSREVLAPEIRQPFGVPMDTPFLEETHDNGLRPARRGLGLDFCCADQAFGEDWVRDEVA